MGDMSRSVSEEGRVRTRQARKGARASAGVRYVARFLGSFVLFLLGCYEQEGGTRKRRDEVEQCK